MGVGLREETRGSKRLHVQANNSHAYARVTTTLGVNILTFSIVLKQKSFMQREKKVVVIFLTF